MQVEQDLLNALTASPDGLDRELAPVQVPLGNLKHQLGQVLLPVTGILLPACLLISALGLLPKLIGPAL